MEPAAAAAPGDPAAIVRPALSLSLAAPPSTSSPPPPLPRPPPAEAHVQQAAEADDSAANEAQADDLATAHTKSMLCQTLFLYSRHHALPSGQVNRALRDLCASPTLLADFERVRAEAGAFECEAGESSAQQAWEASRTARSVASARHRGFFALKSIPLQPSPVEYAQRRGEELMARWIAAQLAWFGAAASGSGGSNSGALKSGHSHSASSPNLLSSIPSPSASFSVRPVLVASGSGSSAPWQSLPHHALSSAPSTPARRDSSVASSPRTPNSSRDGATSPALQRTNGATSPAQKLWRILSGNSSAASAVSSPLLVAPVPSLPSPLESQQSQQQHFDSFPRLDEVLAGLVAMPLSERVMQRFNGERSGSDSIDGDGGLVLHPSFPLAYSLPHSALLFCEEVASEQSVLDSWSDVLWNYRKHVTGDAAKALFEWLQSVFFAATATDDVAGAVPSVSSKQLRVIVMLQHWLQLCPFDFAPASATRTAVQSFLGFQQSRFAPPAAASDSSASRPFAALLSSTMQLLVHPQPSLVSSGAASPLQLLEYPFVAEDVECNLFRYPPALLARELTLHHFELFSKIPAHEFIDGGWINRTQGGEETYSNAYSLASGTASSPAPSATATSKLVGDFNRLVFWIMTEILHPRLNAAARQEVCLYFLELGAVSIRVERNFHVAFAVSAAFSAQPLYRLPEIQALATMDRPYTNPVLQATMEGALAVPAPSIPLPDASAIVSVKTQYEELKSVTSSRSNYSSYRSMLAGLLGESSGVAPTPPLPPPTPPTPLHPFNSRSSSTGTSSSSSLSTSPLRPAVRVEFEPARMSNDSPVFPAHDFAAALAEPLSPRSPFESPPPAVTLIPHLAVHLKDLTYSQELSGVERSWKEEERERRERDGGAALDASAVLSFRFDRSRWSRTTRLVFSLMRLQSLPIFARHAHSHSPPLYTLLQVHLLTHVLPESELMQLSCDICPKADRAKIKQAAQKKKTVSALREEGLL